MVDLKFWRKKGKDSKEESIKVIDESVSVRRDAPNMSADFSGVNGIYTPLLSVTYNGEKSLGAIGPIKRYRPDYEALRLRSWQSYYESEVSHTIINSYIKWVIGKGLKLQCEPIIDVLAQEGIALDRQEFCKNVESRYAAWSKSSLSDYSGMKSKNELSAIAFKNADLGGDVLVILRYINDCVKIQLIDGSHVMSPNYGSEMYPQVLANGNTLLNGIEFSPSGEHVAYHVRDCNFNFERIEAKNSLGLTCAFLYYGSEFRLDNVRGVPKLSTVLEKIATLERYASATLGSAEERQKIAYVMEPELLAAPQNPLQNNMVRAFDANKSISSQIPSTAEGKDVANNVAVSTQKQTFLMPPGIKLKSVESKQELYFRDFHTTYIELISACLGIPSNVAMMLYTESFSASRAALKDWEHTLHVTRNHFARGFEQKVFNFWFEIEVLKNKIQAPGFLEAKMKGNYMVIESYSSVRFVGAPVPHIDPLKEVQAERLKLGDAGAYYPLTTAEAATENLNGGESAANVQQFSEELDTMRKLNIEPKIQPNNNVKENQ